MSPTLGSAASSRNLPAIWRGVRDRFRSATTRARSTGPACTARARGLARRRSAAQSAVTGRQPFVFVELRVISRDTTDGSLPMWRAIFRTPHPAFSPVAISARSANASTLRATRNLQDQQRMCCSEAMTPPSGCQAEGQSAHPGNGFACRRPCDPPKHECLKR
jgi:hypothetical protein